jgi:sugar (pentulose or hexulose) kinase
MAEVLTAGIDIGTSSIKVVLAEPDGTVKASSRVATPWHDGPAGVQADADELADAAILALRDVVRGTAADVAGVGVAGFAESGVVVDGARALAPILPWYAEFGVEEEAELRRDFDAEAFLARTGQPIHRKLSIVKQRWLRKQLGQSVSPIRWLTVPEWVVMRLGGRPIPELSLWSRTGLLRVDQPEVDQELASWSGMDVPADTPQRAGHPCGIVTGLPELCDAVLTVAGHDHVCAAYGAGAIDDSVIFDSWGTGEALVRAQSVRPDPVEAWRRGCSVSWHVAQNRWALMVGLSTGLILRRALQLLGVDHEARGDLDDRALKSAGVTTPRIEIGKDGRLDILDVPADATAAGLWRAALVAVFDRVEGRVSEMESGWGTVNEVVGCGGWLKSSALVRLKSERVHSFATSSRDEAAAVGAARLAMLAQRRAARVGQAGEVDMEGY